MACGCCCGRGAGGQGSERPSGFRGPGAPAEGSSSEEEEEEDAEEDEDKEQSVFTRNPMPDDFCRFWANATRWLSSPAEQARPRLCHNACCQACTPCLPANLPAWGISLPACLPVLSAYQCHLLTSNNPHLPAALPRRTDWWPRGWWACCGRLRGA